MIMANTDETQTQLFKNNKIPTASVGENSAINAAVNAENNSLIKNDLIESKVMPADAPLMRYFDLSEEASYSYVLGYN